MGALGPITSVLAGRFVSLAAITATTLAAAISCGSPGPSPPPTTASGTLAISFSAGGAPTCTGAATWRYSPQKMTGSDGSSSAFNHQSQFTVPATGTTGSGGGTCTVTDSFYGLRAGTWQLAALVGAFSASCNATLNNGGNYVRFNPGDGCSLAALRPAKQQPSAKKGAKP